MPKRIGRKGHMVDIQPRKTPRKPGVSRPGTSRKTPKPKGHMVDISPRKTPKRPQVGIRIRMR